MPKVSIKKQLPKLDMNPMVDMAFLLVSFFMLTTQFKTEEPVQVKTPASQAEAKLPEKDMMTLTVSEEGAVFFTIDGKYDRDQLLRRMASRHEMDFTPEAYEAFSLSSSFGLPIQALPDWLTLDEQGRKRFEMPGIPCDSLSNELAEWVVMARIVNPRLRIAIKGDHNVPYPAIKEVMNTLIDNQITRFSLITDLEATTQEET